MKRIENNYKIPAFISATRVEAMFEHPSLRMALAL